MSTKLGVFVTYGSISRQEHKLSPTGATTRSSIPLAHWCPQPEGITAHQAFIFTECNPSNTFASQASKPQTIFMEIDTAVGAKCPINLNAL